MRVGDHWNALYQSKAESAMSWFEAAPVVSLQLLKSAGLTTDSCVLDIGAGESRLVDVLVAMGLHCLTLLDVSRVAIDHARARLGNRARGLTWLEVDVTGAWSTKPMDIWHDRAVFHFLTQPADRQRYVGRLCGTVKVGGSVVIATFAPDGPTSCSGLPVCRYSGDLLALELGEAFHLEESVPHRHWTPSGHLHLFQYARFRRLG